MSLLQAAEASPTLARLAELTRDSSARLKAIEPLVPAALRANLKAGPVDEQGWSLMVSSTAAAAKLRQLAPTLEAALKAQGWEVNTIRIKVLMPSPR